MKRIKEEFNKEMAKEVTVPCDIGVHRPASVQGRTTGPTRRSSKGCWTEKEDDILTKAVKFFKGKNWKKIAENFPNRTDVQCLHRWQKVLDPNLIKGPWTKEEDDHIIELVEKYRDKKWSVIAKYLPGRIGKQCRERWHNHLNPAIKKGAWTKDEEFTLIHAHQFYGNRWAEIARFLPGSKYNNCAGVVQRDDPFKLSMGSVFIYLRADNSIKNHWNCSVKNKLDSILACASASDMLGVTGSDFYCQERKTECARVEAGRKIVGPILSLGQKMDSEGGFDTYSGVLVLGNANGREKNLQSQPFQIENSASLKEEANYQTDSPSETEFIDKDAAGSIVTNEQCGDNVHHSNSPDNSLCVIAIQPKVLGGTLLGEPVKYSHSHKHTYEPVDPTNLSSPRPPSRRLTLTASCLDVPFNVTNCTRKSNIPPEMVLPVTSKSLLGSPKRIQHHALATNGLGVMVSRLNNESNNTFPSQSTCVYGADNGQACMKNKVTGSTLHSEDKNFGRLCYELPQMKNFDGSLPNGRFSNSDNCIRQSNGPVCCSTPPSHARDISVNCSSPESRLRSAAKSFKHTPSIVRKRRQGGESSTQAGHANDSDGICTPENRTRSPKGLLRLAHSCPLQHSGQDDLNSTDFLNVKQLVLSHPNSLKPEVSTVIKSLEKRLEYEFDMECDYSEAKCSTSDDTSNPSDANPGAATTSIPLENSPNLLKPGSRDPH